jgi:hypothetical protein
MELLRASSFPSASGKEKVSDLIAGISAIVLAFNGDRGPLAALIIVAQASVVRVRFPGHHEVDNFLAMERSPRAASPKRTVVATRSNVGRES